MTVCPACDEPPPRGVTGTPSARQIPIARSASSIVRGDHHAERHDLVVRGVGGIAAAREAVEMHAAGDLGLEPPLQPGQQALRHAVSIAAAAGGLL